jgi:hypothetical protein
VTSVAILGNDAVLAARPATAVQLAHACRRAGFDAAVPASWGDELVAAESARQIRTRGDGVAILCACPHVEARLLALGPDLAPLLVPVVAPPVAAARYLRELYAARPVRVTYVGSCPGAAADVASAAPSIDEQIEPGEFLRVLEARSVSLADQPTVYDSVLPPDRRRFCSLPGGVPVPSCLWEGEQTPRTLVEIESADYKAELAQQILAQRPAVIDLAPRLGCACSGAGSAAPYSSARAAVVATEPPRAAGPIVEPPPGLVLARRLAAPTPRPATPPTAATAVDPTRPAAQPAPPPRAMPTGEYPVFRGTGEYPAYRGGNAPGSSSAPTARPKRMTPSGIFRAYTGHVPTARSPDGRPLPRAYAAHRKSPSANRAVGEATGSFPAFGATPTPPSGAAEETVEAGPMAATLPGAAADPAGGEAAGSAPPRRNAFAFLAFDPSTGDQAAVGAGATSNGGAPAGGPDEVRDVPAPPSSAATASPVRATPVAVRRGAAPPPPPPRRRRTAPVLIGVIALLAAAGAARVAATRHTREASARHAQIDSAAAVGSNWGESASDTPTIEPVSATNYDSTDLSGAPGVSEPPVARDSSVERPGLEVEVAPHSRRGAASGARQRAASVAGEVGVGGVPPRARFPRVGRGSVAPAGAAVAGPAGGATPGPTVFAPLRLRPATPAPPGSDAEGTKDDDSLGGAERERIRLEIEQHRTRIDSIQRRLDWMRSTKPQQR